MTTHRAKSEGSTLVALVLSVVVLVATPIAVLVTGSTDTGPTTVGSRVAAIGDVPVGAVPASSGQRPPAPRPVGIAIPAIGVSAAVLPSGVTANGGVAVPENIGRVGWYRYGARPGDTTGSTVIVGHRDGRTSGAGALFRLDTLRVGDRISVFDAQWQEWRYRVVAREAFNKGNVPYDELFATSGAPRLTVISCGGRFLADRGSYEDNIVVSAVPIGGGVR